MITLLSLDNKGHGRGEENGKVEICIYKTSCSYSTPHGGICTVTW